MFAVELNSCVIAEAGSFPAKTAAVLVPKAAACFAAVPNVAGLVVQLDPSKDSVTLDTVFGGTLPPKAKAAV